MNITPVVIEIEEKDPEGAYNAVRGRDTYLLESSEGGEKVARYSFIGFNPVAKIKIRDGKVRCNVSDPDLKLTPKKGDPVDVMRNVMEQFSLETKTLARFFGGFVGYMSYDIVRYGIDLSGHTTDDLKEPDCEFVLAKNNIIFDHKSGKTYLTSNQFIGQRDIDTRAVEKELAELAGRLGNRPDFETRSKIKKDFTSNQTRKEFKENVKIAKDYIRAGDIFQVVLSQRLETDHTGDKFNVYLALKDINPSPYMYYLDFGKRKVVGSSPEMLVRVDGRKVETYPIAGTRPRGKTPKEDKALEREMLSDEKECAEHVMLVDLGRNDLGRVSRFGTVRLTRFMDAEKYSHVQHIISEVVGRLRSGKDEFDALRSVFPAGTVSGAPKVRAMEIIDELEPTRRGIYAGCVGYFSFDRNMDTAITIRTMVFEGNKAYVQAGAGIVADSKPEMEYIETINKGRALLKALEAAG